MDHFIVSKSSKTCARDLAVFGTTGHVTKHSSARALGVVQRGSQAGSRRAHQANVPYPLLPTRRFDTRPRSRMFPAALLHLVGEKLLLKLNVSQAYGGGYIWPDVAAPHQGEGRQSCSGGWELVVCAPPLTPALSSAIGRGAPCCRRCHGEAQLVVPDRVWQLDVQNQNVPPIQGKPNSPPDTLLADNVSSSGILTTEEDAGQ